MSSTKGLENQQRLEWGFRNTNTSPLLNEANKHVRDGHIVFNEELHIYTVDGKVADISITSLKEIYCEPFDPESAVKCVFSAKAFPALLWSI